MSEKNFQLDDSELESVNGGLAKASYTVQNGQAKPTVMGTATPNMGQADFALAGGPAGDKFSQRVESKSNIRKSGDSNWV